MNFDEIIDRKNNFAAKYDELKQKFGRSDLIPLWIADMDFRTAEPIIEAIKQRADQGIFGYTSRPDSYYEAVCDWLEKYHGWRPEKQLMLHNLGVVVSLSMLIQNFTQPGDKIIIQTPVYYPFFDVIKNNDRKLVENPLKQVNGHYEMDYADFEQQAQNGAKWFLLCSPHNPVGRVWTREELQRIGEICLKYKVRIIADEIHADIVFPGHKHVPIASISPLLSRITITCLAPSKTFNLAGLQASIIIFPTKEERDKFDDILGVLDIKRNSCFNLVAVEAAYRQGRAWLENVLKYIEGNFKYINDYCKNNIPAIKPNYPEGTYLVLLDCRQLGLDQKQLHDFMVNKARVALDDGFWFSNTLEQYMRLNAACPRHTLQKALQQIAEAVHTLQTENI
ncbi:MalY/PatB family protein [Pectinatus haikarae]|uniref:MalY/PatB family protein n=1 Tax=Pectinatus haikarae TaxID=349096 RepID=UPI0018C5BEA6|nr:PatB family C-S lyase [Pectinatus haikarae]